MARRKQATQDDIFDLLTRLRRAVEKQQRDRDKQYQKLTAQVKRQLARTLAGLDPDHQTDDTPESSEGTALPTNEETTDPKPTLAEQLRSPKPTQPNNTQAPTFAQR